MALNIACYVQGCKNPVIGQCQGYKESCGHFYCAQHSNGRLCAEHAEKERIQLIYEDYLHTAESTLKEVRVLAQKRAYKTVWKILLAGLIIGGLPFVLLPALGYQTNLDAPYWLGQISAVFIAVGGVLVLSALFGQFFILSNVHEQITEKHIKEISASKPHFDEFYREWKKHKNREAWNTILTVGLGVVAAGLAGAAEEARTRRAVDDELRRHGL